MSIVEQILVEEFELDPSQINADARLVEDLGLDSLDAVDLISALERSFGGRVPEERVKEVRTVRDVCRLAEAELKAQP